MRDSDWSKKHMLRSDWLRPIVATITTVVTLVGSIKIKFFITKRVYFRVLQDYHVLEIPQ